MGSSASSGGERRYAVRPVTPDLWPALEDLFGRAGASNGCWCMYWRLGAGYHKRPREANRLELRTIVKRGPPPGLLAFDGNLAVGWCQVTPRDELPWLGRAPQIARVNRAADDLAPVWSISCFFVRRGYRQQGITAALIAGAIQAARNAGARVLEAYPVDARQPKATGNRFTGVASTFERFGFEAVASRTPPRPTMRLALGEGG